MVILGQQVLQVLQETQDRVEPQEIQDLQLSLELFTLSMARQAAQVETVE
jgi:hypothetical protein